ncbi:MAG: hypothetical protein ACYTEQ_09415 [Planctomycetota bacterium]|jgi:hypothetical protein
MTGATRQRITQIATLTRQLTANLDQLPADHAGPHLAQIQAQIVAQIRCDPRTAKAHIEAALSKKEIGANWGQGRRPPGANPGGRPRSPYPLQRLNVRCTDEEAQLLKVFILERLAEMRKEGIK